MKKEIKQKKIQKLMNLAIILVISLVCLTSKVNAESIEVTDATFNSSSIPYLIRLSADTTYRPLFELAVDSTDAIKYNFGYMRICGTGEIEVIQDGDCTDGCLNDTINKVYNTNEKCTVADRSGKVTYIFFSINEWEIGSGNTSIWTLKDYMIYKNISTWYSYYQITNVYLTDSNLYPTFEQANAQNQTNNKLDTQINQNQTIIDQNSQQIQQDKEQHDEFMDSDISEEDKTLPDDSKYQDYTNTEDSLKDKVNQANMSVISIGIDANSSAWVWDTLTRLIQSNSIIFGMFISILSIGIIKLALGR